MESKPIFEQLKTRREELGMSMADVARKAGTSPASVCRYEQHWDRFEIYTLQKLANALNCELKLSLEPRQTSPTRVSKPSVVRQLKRLFWDRPLRSDDLTRYPQWVIQRVLEYGSLKDVKMLMRWMGREVFLDGVSLARLHSPKTTNFWHKLLEREGIACTKRSSPSTAWKY